MSFNFNLNEVKQSSSNYYLKPYNIYENVSLSGVEIVGGTSANGNDWKAILLTFECHDGIYKHNIFYATSDKDFERGSLDTPNGGKKELPSKWEVSRNTMAAVGFAFFPEDFAKIQQASSKAKSFDDIAKLFVKAAQNNLNRVSTGMKLIGRNSGGKMYATISNCTGIACASDEKKATSNNVNVGDWYTWMVSPFGKNLTFSDYEQRQRETIAAAKPTKMSEPEKLEDNTESDIDFESLL